MAEALIGAAYLSGSRSLEAALQAIHALRIPLKNLKTWEDVHKPKLSTSSTVTASGKKRKLAGTQATPTMAAGESWMKAFAPPPVKFFDYEFKDGQRVKDILVSVIHR